MPRACACSANEPAGLGLDATTTARARPRAVRAMPSSTLPQQAPAPQALCRRPALSSARLGATRAPSVVAPRRPPLRPARVLAARAAAEQRDGWAVEYLVDMECPLRRAEVASLLNVDRNVRAACAPRARLRV